ncbi:MAG: hypothetical protein RL417_1537, partial [Pseudomonadota bacterium]
MAVFTKALSITLFDAAQGLRIDSYFVDEGA